MNTRLLRRVQKHILAEPKRLRMSNWIVSVENGMFPMEEGRFKFREGGEGNSWGEPGAQPIPPCGTVGCIGGWATVLSGAPSSSGSKVLRLDGGAAERLFYVTSWPRLLQRKYVKAKTAKTRAKIVSQRIDHFIATKGAE